MVYLQIDKNNFIKGVTLDNTSEDSTDKFIEVEDVVLSNSDIVKDEYIGFYDKETWKLKSIDENTKEIIKNYDDKNNCVLSVYRKSNFELKKSDIDLSVVITCCDKDFENINKIIDAIKAAPISNYEIIVVNNCVENVLKKQDGVVYIDTKENIYPFASRIYGAEKAEGNYIWYIDGDDSLDLSFDFIALYLKNKYDVVWMNDQDFKIDVSKTFATSEDMLYYLFLTNKFYFKGSDAPTLHNTFISKKIYKTFCNFEKEKIYFYEDSFWQFYALSKAETIYTNNSLSLYKYNTETNQIKHIQNLDQLYNYLTGFLQIKKLIEYNFSERLSNIIFNRLEYSLPYILHESKLNLEEKDLEKLIKDFDIKHTRRFLTGEVSLSKKDFHNVNTYTNTPLSIIYLFYGTDLEKELDNLNKHILCEHDIVVIDYLNDNIPNTIQFVDNFGKCLKQALNECKYNNVVVLESYKDIKDIDSRDINQNYTTIFNQFNEELDYKNDKHFEDEREPFIRGNVIFSKKDLYRLINQSIYLSLNNLSVEIIKYFKNNPYLISDNLLCSILPFDEEAITFYTTNFCDFLNKNYIAQYCYNDFKKKFPKSKFNIYTEEDLKDLIESSPMTKKIIENRGKGNTLGYENDLLRLLISQKINKSIYTDLDIVVLDKDYFLKLLSVYPNFCCADNLWNHYDYYQNEFMWTLRKNNDYVKKNLEFYENKTFHMEADDDFDLPWNGEVSKHIIDENPTYYLPDSEFKTLDMSGLRYFGKSPSKVMFHFRTSRYKIYKKKQTKNVGILYSTCSNQEDIIKTVDKKLCKENGIEVIFNININPDSDCLTDFMFYHEVFDDIEYVSIELFIDFETTRDLLEKTLQGEFNKDIKVCDVFDIKQRQPYTECCMQNIVELVIKDDGVNLMLSPCCISTNKLNSPTNLDIDPKTIEEGKVWQVMEDWYKNAELPACNQVCFYQNRLRGNANNYYCKFNEKPFKTVKTDVNKSCNLSCVMCRDHKKTYKYQDDIYFKLLDQLKGHNLFEIDLTGTGEPFLYKERTFKWIESLDYEKDCKQIFFISNLTTLNEEDIDWMKQFSVRTGIKFYGIASIDAATKETYYKIRKIDLFDKVVKNAEHLRKYGMLKCINFVLQHDNLNEAMQVYNYWEKERHITVDCIPVNNLLQNINKEDIEKDPVLVERYKKYKEAWDSEAYLEYNKRVKTRDLVVKK